MNNLNAVGMFIFCGSATFGVERAGFRVDQVLEITDGMIEENAYHFAKNRPDIPLTLPSVWEHPGYLTSLAQSKNYDLLYSNCPCSGLSQINRNASVDSETNKHFYRVFEGIKTLKPKVFFIENAPTLAKKGYPILLDMVKQLNSDYKFTIIRDYAGNHNVAMKRMRTVVIGWRKDYFDNKIPLVSMKKQNQMTIKDAIGDLYNAPLGSIQAHVLHEDRDWKKYDDVVIPLVPAGSSMLLTTIEHYDKLAHYFEGDGPTLKQINGAIERKQADKNIWDKTPWRQAEDKPAPSLTSVSCFVHPIHNRQWTIREYARLMGFPDSFEFDLDGNCKVDIMQAMAQGIPAGFVEYIASEINEVLSENRDYVDGSEDKVLNFQHHTHEKFKSFSMEELCEMKELDTDSTFNNLEK